MYSIFCFQPESSCAAQVKHVHVKRISMLILGFCEYLCRCLEELVLPAIAANLRGDWCAEVCWSDVAPEYGSESVDGSKDGLKERLHRVARDAKYEVCGAPCQQQLALALVGHRFGNEVEPAVREKCAKDGVEWVMREGAALSEGMLQVGSNICSIYACKYVTHHNHSFT
jgi:hypothetical protein